MSGMVDAARAGARSLGVAFLNCFLPRFCAVCRARLSADGQLCGRCAERLKPEPFVFCPLCRFDDEGQGRAAWRPGAECRVHAGLAGLAALSVGEPVLELVHRFKYSRERWLARTLADLVPDPGEHGLPAEGYDVMCPVPLFRSRFRERGFNQSADIAALLERRLGVPVVPDLLSKTEPTPEQAKLGGRARRTNLERCFVVARPSVVRDRNVVLVDDLVTTGSTASACIWALRSAGARRVLVLTLAA